VLGVYFVIRMVDLAVNHKFGYLLEGGAPTVMFLIEMIGGVLIPIGYFSDSRTRNDPNGIVWGAYFTMGGLILYRLNSALVFLNGAVYLPSWSELAVTVGLTCFGIILYDLAVRFLPMFPEPTPKVVEEL
jgi:Ni/Fe-hydrogenase subunit HybB-like protein